MREGYLVWCAGSGTRANNIPSSGASGSAVAVKSADRRDSNQNEEEPVSEALDQLRQEAGSVSEVIVGIDHNIIFHFSDFDLVYHH